MVEITFKKMELLDRKTVKITGDCSGYPVKMETSVLQLAKIFGTDRDVIEEMKLEGGFGSEALEEKCEETREYVKQFPVSVQDKKVEFSTISESKKPETVIICAEDIVGWDNEGIMIELPREIYDKKLKDNKFSVFVSPFSVELRVI